VCPGLAYTTPDFLHRLSLEVTWDAPRLACDGEILLIWKARGEEIPGASARGRYAAITAQQKGDFIMGIFNWLRRRDQKASNQSSGKALSVDQILQLENYTEMLIALSNGIYEKINRSGFESLSYAEKVLYHVYWLEAEVNNGGFDQYFFNTSGNYALDTPESLEEIGAHHTAQILRDAISIFPGGPPPRTRDDRDELYGMVTDEIKKKWDELDSKFYEYQDPLQELQIEYMREYKDQIKI
jgi:hypothetical protein